MAVFRTVSEILGVNNGVEIWVRGLKIIANGTVQKLGYGFLFAFHSNYGRILYHFRAKVRYCSKNRDLFIPPAFDTTVRRRNIAIKFGTKKTRKVWLSDPMMTKFD